MSGPHKDALLIEQLIEYAGLTVTELARKASVDPETLRKPLNGKTSNRLSQRTIEKLRETYSDFPGWLKSVQSPSQAFDHQLDQRSVALGSPQSKTLDIPMLELAYGMGGTILDGADDEATVEAFPVAFMRMFTRAPADKLAFASGVGDSMEPTIGDRDLLLIDRSIDAIRMNDQIWALVTGGIGMVKRVRVDSGGIWLLSDNHAVPDYRVAEDELTIIGRVVAITRRL